MNTVLRTDVHKRTPLHFLVDGKQVWVTYLDENGNGTFGVRVKWMENQYSVSPQNHFTDDGGYTFSKYDSYLMLEGQGGVEMRLTEKETDEEKLAQLQQIWVEYQRKLGEVVFSV